MDDVYGVPCHHPLGYDFGLEEEQSHFDHLLSLPLVEGFGVAPLTMTALPFDDDTMHHWHAESMPMPMSMPMLDARALSDVAKSPAQQSHHTGSEGSASLSPSAASHLILTPTSTLLESPYITPREDPESDTNISTSPDSDTPDDYVYVRRRDVQPRAGGDSRMSNNARHPRASPGAPSTRTLPASTHSRESSSRPLSHAPNPAMRDPQSQWQSFTSSSGAMDDFHNYAHSGMPAHDFSLYPDLTSNTGSGFDETNNIDQSFDDLPFRTNTHQQSYQTFTLPSQPQQQVPYRPTTSSAPDDAHHAYPQSFNANSLFFAAQQQQFGSDMSFQNYLSSQFAPAYVQPQPVPQLNTSRVPPQPRVSTSPTNASSRLTVPSSRHAHPQRVKVRATQTEAHPSPTNSQRSASSFESMNIQQTTFHGFYPAIVAADPSRPPAGASRASQQEHKVQKGGRKRNTHLPETSRHRSHQMRKIGACWRCAMQRDPCDHGDPCSRCAMRSQKGQTYYFGCDRSKLPDFITDFLPGYFLHDHQKKSIEDVVRKEVIIFHTDNCMDVYLYSGYGPALAWKLYEFTPKSDDLLFQLQYFQDAQSGKSYTKKKYSPPYGLLRIDSADEARLEHYLEDLLSPHHLKSLGEECYAEENLVDNEMFQCRVLDLLSQLYLQTSDNALKVLLRDILRMMVITYIMGHTLTITEDTLYPVIQNIRRSQKPPACQEQTSPRLANKQLKYFFHAMRTSIYEKILKWQQQTLHTAGKKEQTWLHTFCAMLGFAMVLEEIQRTIMCMADAKIWRNEATSEQATAEAYNSCDRIDERFKLLTGLFQCKYRDKKWGENGSFGPNTPDLRDPVANQFLRVMRSMVERRADHLRRRESVLFSLENQCLYTTRLTAKFLLPFLNLTNAV